MQNISFTPEQLEAALDLKESFFMDKEKLKVIHEATAAGFVFRQSHTQAHWTEAGVKWYKEKKQQEVNINI